MRVRFLSEVFNKEVIMSDVLNVNKDEVFVYLDGLRESGITNMFGAGPYIQTEFEIDNNEARELVLEWMKTFEERHPR